MYKYLIRPLLFRFNPEFIHDLIFKGLGFISKIPFGRALLRLMFKRDYPKLGRDLFGLHFPNPVGLAGGLDKNGEHYNELSDLGFGFVELGSLTPKPQAGNPKPRLFRLPKDQAIINRMGINNKGVGNAIRKLKKDRPEVIVAANIAKNSSSQDEHAAKDYDTAFSLLYDFVDMFVINISCPNVEGLTDLQDISYLSDIMDGILDKRLSMDRHKPVLLKISPDILPEQLDDIIKYARLSGIDGIIAGNTTRSREGLSEDKARVEEIGSGGLSGAPLFKKSLAMVKYIHSRTEGCLPIIGCGGIMTPAQAKEMLDAGASLVEVYSGFIYEGPGFVGRILRFLDKEA